jgi:uncharacterized protein (AIM24 family)
MRSALFEPANAEITTGERWIKQNAKLVKVTLGPDVLAVKGSMVAYQGQVTFAHQGAGSVGKMIRRALTSEDTPLMRVAGQGEVFFARLAQAAVAWSASLTPQVVSSLNITSMLRGGSGEAFQFAFHGPGFVVVQPSEGRPLGGSGGKQQQQSGGIVGDLFK